jgi:predicted nucleotide-binding protein (sugar kinase/HSP70/actin superfamily)
MRRGLEMDFVMPPPMTKRTLELGARYSPDFACAPFKVNLGCFIEAVEAGADTLIQTGGACRLGYFGELHEQILRDLGYEVDFFNLARANYGKPLTFLREFRRINPKMSMRKVVPALLGVLKMVEGIDGLEDYLRKNVGFEQEAGAMDRIHRAYLDALRSAENKRDIQNLTDDFMGRMRAVPVRLPERPLKVGVIGDYYTIMDPFSNHRIERELAKRGVVVDRWLNISNSLFRNPTKAALERVKPYVKYNIGATGLFTVERALAFAKEGYDGVVQVKAFGCTPETDAVPILQNISRDYNMPILYFSFDTQTGDEGINTRIEAFCDMIEIRHGKGSKT